MCLWCVVVVVVVVVRVLCGCDFVLGQNALRIYREPAKRVKPKSTTRTEFSRSVRCLSSEGDILILAQPYRLRKKWRNGDFGEGMLYSFLYLQRIPLC